MFVVTRQRSSLSGFVAGNVSSQDGAANGAHAAKPSAISASTLSSRLQILTEPSIAAAPAAERAEAMSLAQNGPGSLLRQGKQLIVNVRFEALRARLDLGA